MTTPMQPTQASASPPLTGREPYWGSVTPSAGQVALMNDSPTLVSELRDYGNAVDRGQLQPFAQGSGSGTYFSYGRGITLGRNAQSQPAGQFVSTLSHELYHFENASADQAFNARYPVNRGDPGAFGVAAMKGVHDEGEAIYNNWKVQQEIRDAGGTFIDLAGERSNGPTQQTLDRQHAQDVANGLGEEQDRNLMTADAMGVNAMQRPSTSPNENYLSYYGRASGATQRGLGTLTGVTFSDPNGSGEIQSMTERYASGRTVTQHFNEANAAPLAANTADGQGDGAPIVVAARGQDAPDSGGCQCCDAPGSTGQPGSTTTDLRGAPGSARQDGTNTPVIRSALGLLSEPGVNTRASPGALSSAAQQLANTPDFPGAPGSVGQPGVNTQVSCNRRDDGVPVGAGLGSSSPIASPRRQYPNGTHAPSNHRKRHRPTTENRDQRAQQSAWAAYNRLIDALRQLANALAALRPPSPGA